MKNKILAIKGDKERGNEIIGDIVDVKDEYDEIFGHETWFYVKNEQNGIISKYGKEELQEITIGVVYKDLE